MARPRKPASEPPAPAFDPAALDALLGDARTADDVDALFRQMKKALMERILGAELTHHLGDAPGDPKPATQPNHRNGTTPKTVVTDDGALPLAIPRDRAGTFTPQLVPKGVRRLPRFDQNVLSLYARGMSVREIRAHLEELYQVEVAPDLISTVTDEVLEEITAWQQRPLESCSPVVFFDALRVTIRDEGVVRTKAVYLAQIHTCVVHLVRRSLAYVSYQDRKRVAAALRTIYRAETVAAGEAALVAFAASPDGTRYPTIAPLWQRQWDLVTPAFAYPPAIRRILTTTNALESLHMQLRKIIKTRGHFPTDEAATKLLYLALRNVKKRWHAAPAWQAALTHFAVLFPDRLVPEA